MSLDNILYALIHNIVEYSDRAFRGMRRTDSFRYRSESSRNATKSKWILNSLNLLNELISIKVENEKFLL